MNRIMSKKKFPDEAELYYINQTISDNSGFVECVDYDSITIIFDSFGDSIITQIPFGNSFNDFVKNCRKTADNLDVEVIPAPTDPDLKFCENDAEVVKEKFAGFLKDVASDIEKRFVKTKNTAKCR